jgi:hypothetical protein
VAATTPAVVAASAPPAPANVAVPARHPEAVGRPWSLGRALGRAAIGAVLATFLQLFWLIGEHSSILEDDVASAAVGSAFGSILFYFLVGAMVLTGLFEGAVKSLRIPSGSAWGAVGHNRWVVAAIVGILMGLVVGLTAEALVLQTDFATIEGTGAEIVAFAAVGWLVAELIVGRGKAKASAAAA